MASSSSDPLDLSLGLSLSSSFHDNNGGDQTRRYQFGPPGLKPFVFINEQVTPSPLPPLQIGRQAPPQELPVSHEQQLSKKRRRIETRAPKARASGSSSTSPPERKKNKTEDITPPYPWSTNKRCRIYTAQELASLGHVLISGRVKCRKCEQSYEMSFDLNEKLREVTQYIASHGDELCHRAPAKWMNPVLPRCRCCGQENSVKPDMEGKKKNINWLFLFLGEMIGCCTGEQLKYFCKYNGQHRTAAKDRLLFLTYFIICTQLYPQGLF